MDDYWVGVLVGAGVVLYLLGVFVGGFCVAALKDILRWRRGA